MSAQWNEKASQLITEKLEKMKKELGDRPVDVDNIVEVLKELHPEISPETLHRSVEEIQAGIGQIYQAETEQMNESSAQILDGQMEEMTEEQKKGFLCQLFDSIKLSDEAVDSEIENVGIDDTDLAQMSTEELRTLVSEQLVNSIKGMMGNVLEENTEEIAGMDMVSLRTEEDALLLAAAQYSEALTGNISFEYTKVPRVLGQCAAAQARIAAYCDGMVQTDLSEEEKYNKIIAFIEGIVAVLAAIVFSVVFGIMIGEVACALMTVAFDAVAALFGTGIIAFIAELVLLYPIMLVSFAGVIGMGALVYYAGQGAYALFKAAASKIKEFYHRLGVWLHGEDTVDDEEENYDSADLDWDDLDEEDMEEDSELAYT